MIIKINMNRNSFYNVPYAQGNGLFAWPIGQKE